MPAVIVGFDVGQERDPAALCAVEQWRRTRTDRQNTAETVYMIRRIDRALRIGYREMCIWCRQRTAEWGCAGAPVALDYTGVGRPFLVMLREQEMPNVIRPIQITAGHKMSEWEEYGFQGFNVPKKELVSLVKLLIQHNRLGIDPELPDAKVLGEELLAFEFTVTEAGNVTFSARSGAHDDVLLSVALALWLGENTPCGWDGGLGMGNPIPQPPRGSFGREAKGVDPYREDGLSPRQAYGVDGAQGGVVDGTDIPSQW